MRAATIALTIGCAAIAFQLLTGRLLIVTTHGVSMEPVLTEGDLVVTRRAGDYSVGDVIAFHSEQVRGRVVLHRIEAVRHGRYITKGDNNSWIDHDRPTDADIAGEAWLHIPGGGHALAFVSRMGPTAGLALFPLLYRRVVAPRSGASITDTRLRRRRKRPLT